MPLRYNLNSDKLLEALVWLASNYPGIDSFHIAKTLFYADKAHLNAYGRPIFGDVYVAMKDGPVPSKALDFVHRNPYLGGAMLEDISNSLEFEHEAKYPSINAKREPNLKCFSQTDIECLKQAAKQYALMDFGQLWNIVHQEPAYVAARKAGGENPQLDFELLIEGDEKERQELLQEIRESAANLVM